MAKATGLLLPPYRRGGNSIQVDNDKMSSVQFKTFCIFASSIQFLLEPSTKNAKKINNLSKRYLIYSLNVVLQRTYAQTECVKGLVWVVSIYLDKCMRHQRRLYCNKCNPRCIFFSFYVQVNLFQKHLFLHQLTHNITADCPPYCSWLYQFST